MKLSEHALARCGQRSIPQDRLELVMQFGTPMYRPGHVVEYRLGRKEVHDAISRLKRQIQRLSNAANTAALVGDNGQVITTYHVRKWCGGRGPAGSRAVQQE